MKEKIVIFGLCALAFVLWQVYSSGGLNFGGSDKSETEQLQEQLVLACPGQQSAFQSVLRYPGKGESSAMRPYPFDRYTEDSIQLYIFLIKQFLEIGMCPQKIADAPERSKEGVFRALTEKVWKVADLCPEVEKNFGYLLRPVPGGYLEERGAERFLKIAESYMSNDACIAKVLPPRSGRKKEEAGSSTIVAPQIPVASDKDQKEIDRKRIYQLEEEQRRLKEATGGK